LRERLWLLTLLVLRLLRILLRIIGDLRINLGRVHDQACIEVWVWKKEDGLIEHRK
jgi:hypothetical protein